MSEHPHDDELAPTITPGYKPGEIKSMEEYHQLDAEDESLQKWKASLGVTGQPSSASGPNVIVKSLSLLSETRSEPLTFDLTDEKILGSLKSTPITIKEGVEYSVAISFEIKHTIVTGLKYLQVIKRAGLKVDKMEEMLGSYGPNEKPYTKVFPPEESPSGVIARSGSYNARSRIVDDDGSVYVDFSWTFKLAKEW